MPARSTRKTRRAPTALAAGRPPRVIVGSRNGPKIAAVRDAFAMYRKGVRVRGVAVDPGVPEQPVGWGAIVRGAKNRARGAYRAAPCDLGVGYEDGLVRVPGTRTGHANFGCCAIYDGRRFSLGFSAGFEYPVAGTEAALSRGTPVGDTFDALFARAAGGRARRRPSSLTVGNVGVLTGGRLARRAYTREAVILALTQLRHPGLFDRDVRRRPRRAGRGRTP